MHVRSTRVAIFVFGYDQLRFVDGNTSHNHVSTASMIGLKKNFILSKRLGLQQSYNFYHNLPREEM